MNNSNVSNPLNTPPPGANCIAYTRAATTSSSFNNKAAQQQAIAAYCKKHNLVLIKTYDEASVGKSTKEGNNNDE